MHISGSRLAPRGTVRGLLRSLVVVPALVLAAAGCGGDKVAESLSERMIEGVASGNVDVDVDVDSDSGEVTLRDKDGNTVTSFSQQLPPNFPDNVAMIDGDVVSAVETDVEGGKGYVVVLVPKGNDAEAVFKEAGAQLEGKGWVAEPDTNVQMEGMRVQQFIQEPWRVSFGLMGTDELQAQYTVIPLTD